jgi:fatty acid desaturase
VAVSGHNLFMPKVFAMLVLNFNLHRIHHRHPNVPWIELPDYFARQFETYDQNFLIALLHQLCGPIPKKNRIGQLLSHRASYSLHFSSSCSSAFS